MAEELAENDSQNSQPVSNGVEVAGAVDAVVFEAGNLGDLEPVLQRSNIDEGLDLETGDVVGRLNK